MTPNEINPTPASRKASGNHSVKLSKALLGLAIACCCTISLTFAKFGDGLGGGISGGDQTIGTLPMHGNDGDTIFDQTVTLRGTELALSRAIAAASGDGWVERIELGENADGDEVIWYRFFGDVRLELDLASLASVDVEVFSGFDGGGMNYAVGQGGFFGSSMHLDSGGIIDLDPIRLANSGLLDDMILVIGLHRTGNRTVTSLDRLAGAGAGGTGTIVLFQDV